MTYLFLDTMIYLHYAWFEDIDWQDVAGDSDIQIVVPHITLNELDTKKDRHKSSKVRDRARKVVNRLYECITQNDGCLKGSLRVGEFDESAAFDFSAHNLEKSKNDHHLLAAIIEFKNANAEPVILITEDSSLRFKTHKLVIIAKQLPAELRLLPEEDPVVKENKQLKNELLKIKSAAPNLSLGFAGKEGSHIERTVTPQVDVIDVDAEMEKVFAKFPREEEREQDIGNFLATQLLQKPSRSIGEMFGIPDSEYRRYNKDREEYIEQCEVYFTKLEKYQKQCRVELNLRIRNEGGAPAEDVDVYMYFPDGFELYPMDDMPEEPEAPKPPQEPRSSIEISMAGMRFDSSLIHSHHFPDMSSLGPPDPFSLKKTNSYEVKDVFPRIKHGQVGVIRPLMIVFDSYESATSFQITYRISAANLQEPVEGELNVIVRKGDGE